MPSKVDSAKNKSSLLILPVLVLLTVAIHNVPKKVNVEDIEYISKYLEPVGVEKSPVNYSAKEEIAVIKKIQESVLKISPAGKGIPQGSERRPKDLFTHGEGLCYDRSFTLELIFQSLGFDTRHVSLFEDNLQFSTLKELSSKGTLSHAATEVKTKNGWLIVDSSYPWLALDKDGIPYSMKKIEARNYSINWEVIPPLKFYKSSSHFIYGLYSRHGKFYKPYNFIPDYNLKELTYNLY